MSTSLYDIGDRFKQALSVVERGDFELIDMQDTLDGIEGEFNDKAINVVKFAQNLTPIANAKRDLAKKLIEEAKAIENKHQAMLDYLDSQMQKTGIKEISCDYFTIKYRKNPASVEVVDESLVPDNFINEKVTRSVNKKAAKNYIQDGNKIAGLKLVTDKQTLVIK